MLCDIGKKEGERTVQFILWSAEVWQMGGWPDMWWMKAVKLILSFPWVVRSSECRSVPVWMGKEWTQRWKGGPMSIKVLFISTH